jgi:hypothetical protein
MKTPSKKYRYGVLRIILQTGRSFRDLRAYSRVLCGYYQFARIKNCAGPKLVRIGQYHVTIVRSFTKTTNVARATCSSFFEKIQKYYFEV